MRKANYMITDQTNEAVTIMDLGPWDKHPTITNSAEGIVAELVGHLRGRRLFYYDSDNRLDEILIKDGKFAGFAPVEPTGGT